VAADGVGLDLAIAIVRENAVLDRHLAAQLTTTGEDDEDTLPRGEGTSTHY